MEQREDQQQKYLLLPDYGPLLGMEAQVEGNNHKPEEKAIVMLLVGSNNMRITRVWDFNENEKSKLNKEQMARIKIHNHGLAKKVL